MLRNRHGVLILSLWLALSGCALAQDAPAVSTYPVGTPTTTTTRGVVLLVQRCDAAPLVVPNNQALSTLCVDSDGNLKTGASAGLTDAQLRASAVPVSIAGTLTVASHAVTNAGTFATQATLAAETTKVIGTVNQGTSPWIVAGGKTNDAAAPGTNNIGALTCLYNTTAPTPTSGNLGTLSCRPTDGSLRVYITNTLATDQAGDAAFVQTGPGVFGYGSAATPTAMSTDGDATAFWLDKNGRLHFFQAGDSAGAAVDDITCPNSKIYDASTSGNTELVPISGSKDIFVCGYEMLAAGTVNLSLVAGTGTACASAASGTPNTGTSGANAALTPAWQFTAQTGKLSAWPTHGWLLRTGTANALCIKASGGVAAQAQVWYNQK